MPWKEQTPMSLRQEFVEQALTISEDSSRTFAALCRQFGISRKTGYKWLSRYRQEGLPGLEERSRRPHQSPNRTPPQVEEQIVAVRTAHPAWGGRKIAAFLQRQQVQPVPHPSTITAILRRRGLIDPQEAAKHRPYQRFERGAPNELWQIDFKGPLHLLDGTTVYPLTVLDDHSRYLLAVRLCPAADLEGVVRVLTELFREFGLPDALLKDNGPPWGDGGHERYTAFEVWLIRLNIKPLRSRPYHPQTLGKNERLHRTMQEELIAQAGPWADWETAQAAFAAWREVYNNERPHEALGGAVPADRYSPSSRRWEGDLPPLEFPAHALVRKVDRAGYVYLRGQRYKVGRGLVGESVGLVPGEEPGTWHVYLGSTRLSRLVIREP